MDAVAAPLAPQASIRFRWRVTPLRLAFGLMLLAAVLRLVGIELRPLWLDEAYTAWFSSQGWHELWTVVPTYEPHPPFYYSLMKLWRDVFGGNALALRASSVLLALATIPVVIACSAELERQRPTGRPMLRAGIAGFLAAASPMLVMLGAEARPYPLLILAYSVGTLALLRLMRSFSAGAPGDAASWLMLAGGTEVGLWAHGLGLLYGLCLGAALAPAWSKSMTSERLVRGVSAATAVALLYLPCLAMIMNRAGDWGTGWISWRPIMLVQLLGLYTVPFDVLTIGSILAAVAMLLLAKRAVEASLGANGWTADRALLLLWLGPPILAALVSQLAMPIFLPRTLSATLIPAYLLFAGALANVRDARERLLLSAALVITILPSSVQTALRPATEPWDSVAAYLRQHVGPSDKVWLYPNDSAVPLREAGASTPIRGIPGEYPAVAIKGPVRAGSPAVVSVTAGQANAIALTDTGAPTVWLVTRQSGIFDPYNDMPKALAKVRVAGPVQEWGYIAVQPFYRRSIARKH
jgi:hypothetical protein